MITENFEDLSGKKFLSEIRHRRSVREFSSEKVPREILLRCIEAAGQAPSGANSQPWYFVLIENEEIKKKIRIAAEAVEQDFYERRISDRWREDLKPFQTTAKKPYLTEAPALIVVFSRKSTPNEPSYYPTESTGIATGFLLTALHLARLSTLTHTPSPMNFLNEILDVPKNYRAHMIVVTGYPKEGARYPELRRKSLPEISKVI